MNLIIRQCQRMPEMKQEIIIMSPIKASNRLNLGLFTIHIRRAKLLSTNLNFTKLLVISAIYQNQTISVPMLSMKSLTFQAAHLLIYTYSMDSLFSST